MIDATSTSRGRPRISIVTPSFNAIKYIEDCIRSVADQRYPDFEHVIVDGGSTDGTLEILQRYPHVKWISEPDEGQSDALNKGLAIASGEIIGWLNSDDVYRPGTFDKVSKLLSDDVVDGVYSNIYFGDARLNITRRVRSHRPIKWLALFHCYIPSATFFFKRKIIDQGILIDKRKHITMDKDWFARILYGNYRLKYVDDYFAIFRWHAANKSLNNRETRRILLKEGVELFNRYSRIKLPDNPIGYFIYKHMHPFLVLFKLCIVSRKRGDR